MGPKTLYKYMGKEMTLERWSVETGIKESTIRTRMRKGETFIQAISRPAIEYPVQMITYQGKSMPLHDWCRQYGIHLRTCKSRLKNGWSIHDALTTPSRKKNKQQGEYQ